MAPRDIQTLVAGMMVVALLDVSRRLLGELIATRGRGPWIEELKAACDAEAKQSIIEGVSIDREPMLYAAALSVIELVFNEAGDELSIDTREK